MASTIYDLAFLHPPLSFKKIVYPLSGIFDATVGTSDMLTMNPVGMFSLANVLRRNGYRTKIFNVAKVFLSQRRDPSVDTWQYVREINAHIYGIGLHWSAHAAGALELAQRIKKERPESVVLFGGLTATKYYEELLREHPYIDFVMLAECEHAIEPFVKSILDGSIPQESTPNLAYRAKGEIRATETFVPERLADVDYFAYPGIFDPEPKKFDRENLAQPYPIIRGCYRNCRFCGGSEFSYKRFFFRRASSPVPMENFRNHLQQMMNHDIRVLRLIGDTRGFGPEYDSKLRDEIVSTGFRFDTFLELFDIPTYEYLRSWREISNRCTFVFSPESSFEKLRKASWLRNPDINIIVKRYRLQQHSQVVVAIASSTKDVQTGVDLGRRLESAQKEYNGAMNKLKTSPRAGSTLIGKVEKLRELGAKTSKRIPEELLDG